MKKILLVATVQSHICQFHKPLVKMLHDHGCEVHVAARDNLAEKNGLKLDFVDQIYNIPFERSPLNKRNISAYRQLQEIINQGQYDVVHTNTPVGGVLGRLAARNVRETGCKVFYTAHGFHFFKGGSKKNWVLYYPLEKFMCRYTDTLITITEEDHQLASQKFNVNTAHIHGIGANTQKYYVRSKEECADIRRKLGYSENDKIILCTGELNPNKNQITAIRAMKGIVEKYPNTKLLLAGNGSTYDELINEAKTLGLSNHVELLGYRTDLERFVSIADVILSCSKREGLPVNIIEGMLCGKPVVASVNRGHKELVSENNTGYLTNALDIEQISACCVDLINDSDKALEYGLAGKQKAQDYTDIAVYSELEEIYRKHDIV